MTAALAIPPVARGFFELLYRIQGALFETTPLPSLPPVAWLFVNIAGVLGVVWAIVRIRRPSTSLALTDAIARCFVAALIVYYVVTTPVPLVFLAFVATEVVGTGLQLGFVRAPE
ncbi:MAG: hypothetical protein JRH01_05905 [Deltaproteobacteria bacterium]|nr:hypothetical protein [Deltaproteobacteria bacterium]